MMPEMEACYVAAGIIPRVRHGNTGRCAECHLSAKITAGAPCSAHIGWLWCYKYHSFCKSVARNCKE